MKETDHELLPINRQADHHDGINKNKTRTIFYKTYPFKDKKDLAEISVHKNQSYKAV